MILCKGNELAKQRRVEIALKVMTFLLPFIEVANIWWDLLEMPSVVKWIGVAASGMTYLIVGMLTMRDSWRAGIPEQKETTLVSKGIYHISHPLPFWVLT